MKVSFSAYQNYQNSKIRFMTDKCNLNNKQYLNIIYCTLPQFYNLYYIYHINTI